LKNESAVIEFTIDMQRLFLEMAVQDHECFARVQNIFNPENFDRKLRDAAAFIKEHADKYKVVPDRDSVRAKTSVDLEPRPTVTQEWFLAEFEKFTQHRELERAILKSADMLEKGNFGPVEKIIKDAINVCLARELGTDYFHNVRERLMAIKSNNGQLSTGWPVLDSKLYGGFNRGELQIFAGGSGSGKSLFMQNLAANWVMAGLSGVYITLELSEGLCSMRLDSMMTDIASKEIFRNIDDVELKLGLLQKKSGNFMIKYMPAQSTVNDIRAYVKNLEIERGVKIDFMCVDYLDLLMPVSAKVSPNDLFVKDKYVSEELRNLARELNVLFVTASQLNRSAVEEIEFDHSHISGGISKINTADNVFGIFTSRSMREKGRYQIQLMKTRSSSGVGSKIDLEFNIETLRIRDCGEQEDANSFRKPTVNILDSIKGTSKVLTSNTDSDDVPKITADVQSTKLKAMLGAIKQNKN
jgi:replicative DNA helicase